MPYQFPYRAESPVIQTNTRAHTFFSLVFTQGPFRALVPISRAHQPIMNFLGQISWAHQPILGVGQLGGGGGWCLYPTSILTSSCLSSPLSTPRPNGSTGLRVYHERRSLSLSTQLHAHHICRAYVSKGFSPYSLIFPWPSFVPLLSGPSQPLVTTSIFSGLSPRLWLWAPTSSATRSLDLLLGSGRSASPVLTPSLPWVRD